MQGNDNIYLGTTSHQNSFKITFEGAVLQWKRKCYLYLLTRGTGGFSLIKRKLFIKVFLATAQ